MSTARGIKGVITAGASRWDKRILAKQKKCGHVWYPFMLGRICTECGLLNEDFGLQPGERYVGCSEPTTTYVAPADTRRYGALSLRSVNPKYVNAAILSRGYSRSPMYVPPKQVQATLTVKERIAQSFRRLLNNLSLKTLSMMQLARKKNKKQQKN